MFGVAAVRHGFDFAGPPGPVLGVFAAWWLSRRLIENDRVKGYKALRLTLNDDYGIKKGRYSLGWKTTSKALPAPQLKALPNASVESRLTESLLGVNKIANAVTDSPANRQLEAAITKSLGRLRRPSRAYAIEQLDPALDRMKEELTLRLAMLGAKHADLERISGEIQSDAATSGQELDHLLDQAQSDQPSDRRELSRNALIAHTRTVNQSQGHSLAEAAISKSHGLQDALAARIREIETLRTDLLAANKNGELDYSAPLSNDLVTRLKELRSALKRGRR